MLRALSGEFRGKPDVEVVGLRGQVVRSNLFATTFGAFREWTHVALSLLFGALPYGVQGWEVTATRGRATTSLYGGHEGPAMLAARAAVRAARSGVLGPPSRIVRSG